jgi:hypothetical protein
MANNMIKFYRGLVASLPETGADGALYITTDEGGIYLGTGTGMKRLGDFVQVANVEALPEKAHENCLYYCVAENILAKWTGTEWKQVNKQPTTEELKTLLGLGTLAYKSEVAEADLNEDLAAKINASTAANHGHDNKTVLDGITAEKVTAWDAAEGNAKGYADGLNTAMNTRVEALEAVDHEHANKALLDTYTQTEENLADAVAKKHAHTFVESELNKIADGDVAKWNAVVADHLDSEDETALKALIKEAKQAGTDANTNIEAYKVTNDARVLAVEEDVAEIVDGTSGILAQAKTYSDGKLATARTEITAEIDADVKVVADELAGVKATAEAAATKTYTDEELAKKVDKVEGKSLVSDTEITKLAGVSEGANKVEASTTNGSIKIDGVETVVYTHPEKHTVAEVDGLQDALDAKVAKSDYETDKATFATKTELNDVDAKFASYKTAADQKVVDDEQDRRLGVIEGDYVKAADIADFETKANVKKVADDLAAYVESNDAALAAETKARTDADAGFETRIAALEGNFGDGEGTVEAQIAAAVEAEAEARKEAVKGVQDAVDAVEGRMDTAEGKITALETASATHAVKTEVEDALALKADKSVVDAMYTNEQIDAAVLVETNRAKGVEESLQTQINTLVNNPDTEGVINSINEFTKYIEEHGEIAEGFRADIDANTAAIEAHVEAVNETLNTSLGEFANAVDARFATKEELATTVTELEDKYFVEVGGGNEIVFDHATTPDATSISVGLDYGKYNYVKVSDTVLTDEDLLSAEIYMGACNSGEYALYTFADGRVADVRDSNYENTGAKILVQFFSSGSSAFEIPVVVIPTEEAAAKHNAEVGTYVLCQDYGTDENGTPIYYHVNKIVLAREVVAGGRKLDEQYLPADMARTADVEDLGARVQELEAIDHEAYVGADEALREELVAEIEAAKTDATNKDVVVLAEAQAYADQAEADAIAAAKAETEAQVQALVEDGQVKTNTDDIASIIEQMTWGSF